MVWQPTFWGNLKQYGAGDFARGFGHGVMESFGFEQTGGKKLVPRNIAGRMVNIKRPTGPWKFAGGGLGGAAMGAVTGTLQGGMAGGIVGAGIGYKFGMIPAFMAMGAIQGFQEGGIGGAVGGAAKSVAEWGLFRGATAALSLAFKGTAIGGIGTAIGTIGLGPLALAAAAGYGVYKASQALAEYGRDQTRMEFQGDMQAFQTQAAYTMRQRSVQEIQRSHTNGRTVLGNEASYMHLR